MDKHEKNVKSMIIALFVFMCFLVMPFVWLISCPNCELRCQRDCTALSYKYSSVVDDDCRCWNEGMELRYNPWGRQ